MCSASAALLAFSNHNPIQPASSLTGQDYGNLLAGHVHLAAIQCRCNNNNYYYYCNNSALVSSVVRCLFNAPHNSRIFLLAVSSHLVSHIDPLCSSCVPLPYPTLLLP